MVECTACHECANSEAQYDSENGAHASFGRCGEHVQGEGGGATCADVIDGSVSERAPDEHGVMRCRGHCGPIVAPGCQTFLGQGRRLHPGECFTHETSPDGTCDDPEVDAEPGPDILACE